MSSRENGFQPLLAIDYLNSQDVKLMFCLVFLLGFSSKLFLCHFLSPTIIIVMIKWLQITSRFEFIIFLYILIEVRIVWPTCKKWHKWTRQMHRCSKGFSDTVWPNCFSWNGMKTFCKMVLLEWFEVVNQFQTGVRPQSDSSWLILETVTTFLILWERCKQGKQYLSN
jgi:hypothetical protein